MYPTLVPLAVGDVIGPITKFGSMATSDMPSAFANSCAAFSASVCGCEGSHRFSLCLEFLLHPALVPHATASDILYHEALEGCTLETK